jgi:hypothetical protein
MLLACVLLAGCRVPNEPAPYDNGHYALTLGMTLAPTSASVTAGSTTDVVVAVARGGGLNGTVHLLAGGMPEGVTISFAPHPLSGPTTSSTMTIAAASTAGAGRYPLTIRATLGAYEAASQLSLEVR